MLAYQTCLIRRVGQLYKESVDDYGESADPYIPTGVKALEPADSELKSADSSADSAKVSVWVRQSTLIKRTEHQFHNASRSTAISSSAKSNVNSYDRTYLRSHCGPVKPASQTHVACAFTTEHMPEFPQNGSPLGSHWSSARIKKE